MHPVGYYCTSPQSSVFRAEHWGLNLEVTVHLHLLRTERRYWLFGATTRSNMQVNTFRDRHIATLPYVFKQIIQISHGTGWLLSNLPWPRTIRQWQRSHYTQKWRFDTEVAWTCGFTRLPAWVSSFPWYSHLVANNLCISFARLQCTHARHALSNLFNKTCT